MARSVSKLRYGRAENCTCLDTIDQHATTFDGYTRTVLTGDAIFAQDFESASGRGATLVGLPLTTEEKIIANKTSSSLNLTRYMAYRGVSLPSSW